MREFKNTAAGAFVSTPVLSPALEKRRASLVTGSRRASGSHSYATVEEEASLGPRPYSRPLPGAGATSTASGGRPTDGSPRRRRRSGGALHTHVKEDLLVLRAEYDFVIQSPPRLAREEWTAYYKSDRWASLRAEARAAVRYRCVECGRSHRLHLHHKHYFTFGNETLDDVEWLCVRCHRNRHRKARRTRS
jgi:hypothetical protein